MSTTPLQIRLDDDIIARLDALVEPMTEADPFLANVSAGKFSRSSVARLAIFQGLKDLEAKFLKPKTPQPSPPKTQDKSKKSPAEETKTATPGKDEGFVRPSDVRAWVDADKAHTIKEAAEKVGISASQLRSLLAGKNLAKNKPLPEKYQEALKMFLGWK